MSFQSPVESHKTKKGSGLCWTVLFLIFLLVNVFRFIGLEEAPPGFHVDELGGAVTIQCLVTEGRDAKGHSRLPLIFSDLKFGTPKPPTYIYPAMAWTKVFGFSIASFRGFIACIVLLTTVGLYLLARTFFGGTYAALVGILATVSPWAWMFSRIAYEPMLGPCLLVWGLLIFFNSRTLPAAFFSALFFAGAMYSYPPMRLQIPLMLFTLFIFRYPRKEIKPAYIVTHLFTMGAALIPLGYYILKKDLQSRFGYIGITSQEYLTSIGKTGTIPELVSIFAANFARHFYPDFLIYKGSPNAMHSTGFVGILSWGESLAVLAGIVLMIMHLKKHPFRDILRPGRNQLIFLLLANVFIAVIPSALTWEGLPHALRTIIAWPFVVLLTGFAAWRTIERWPPALYVITVVTLIFTVVFGLHYFREYPAYTYGMYSPWSKEQALAAKTQEDWLKFVVRHRHQDYHTCYYLMNYNGESCTSCRAKWEAVNKALRK